MEGAEAVLERLRGALRSIRPRFWLLGVGGVIALVVAVLAVPIEAPASGAIAQPGPTESAAVILPPADAAIVAAIVGDDPAAASLALVARRAACTADSASACLAEVLQPGSAQEATDRAALDTAGELLSVHLEGEPQVQRMGDAALVSFGATSVLLVRTDLGWRIRDLFSPAS